MTLQNITKGQRYVIQHINSHDPALTSKLLALGIIPGEQVELMHKAPLGDPLQIKAGGTYISIRQKDCLLVEVEHE